MLPEERIRILEKYWDIDFKHLDKSLLAFETIWNEEVVKNILENQIMPNKKVRYAELILPPKAYEVLWEENIKEMSYDRIHILWTLVKRYAEVLHNAPCSILTNEDITMERVTPYLKIRDMVSEDPILVSALEDKMFGEELSSEHNEAYANFILSDEKRKALWKKTIMDKNMSPERMNIIELHLSAEEISALWEWIVHENMLIDKFFLIARLGIDQITDIWAEELAKMSMSDLEMAVFC